MATAGNSVTITKPWFFYAEIYPTPPVFPSLSLAFRAAWPTGFARAKGFQNGVTVTLQKPMAAIQTSDLGIVAYVSTGAHGIQVQSQFRLPTAALLEKLASFYAVEKSVVAGPPAFPAATIWSFDPTDELDTNPVSEFRVGIEGLAQAGGLWDTTRIMRFVGFRGQQGGNIALRQDHSGNDAGLFPTMTLQLLPYEVTSTEVSGTGMTTADIKSDKGVFIAPVAA